MNNKKIQKIRAEIERRITLLEKNNVDNPVFGVSAGIVMEELRHLLSFIDTIEVKEEPISEDLEEAARKADQKYFPDKNNIWARPNYEAKAAEYAFKDGVNWQKKQMIDNACEWLKSYRQDTPDGTGYVAGIVNDKTIKDFKKTMEE